MKFLRIFNKAINTSSNAYQLPFIIINKISTPAHEKVMVMIDIHLPIWLFSGRGFSIGVENTGELSFSSRTVISNLTLFSTL